MLRVHISGLNELLSEIDFTVGFARDKTLPIPGGYLLPAVAVGILTRIYRLHARISDWLGIREHFDIEIIISELASQSAIDFAAVPEEQLRQHRPWIMRNAFYPFVSGSQPQIDPQLIQQALDAWSWFWIGIELSLIFVVTGFCLIAGGVLQTGLQTIGGTLVLSAIGLPAMRSHCKRYAVAQVRAIVADSARAAAVRRVFAELTTDKLDDRLAA